MHWRFSTKLGNLYYPGEDLRHLIVSGMLRKAAVSALSLFSPVYVYKCFYSFGVSKEISLVAAAGFFLIVFLTKLPTILFSENLSQKIGFKGVLRLSTLPFFLFILAIMISYRNLYFFPVAAIFWGIHAGLFWWGYHGYFVKSGDSRHFGASIGEMNLVDTIVSVSIPLLGALVISYLGFFFLYLFSAVLVLLSQYFLGRDHDKKQKRDIKVREIFELIWKHKTVSLAYLGSSAQGVVYSVAWPLFLFLFFERVIDMGVVVSLSALIASLFAVTVGNWVDKKGADSSILAGLPLIFISWILRLLGRGFGFFVAADSIWNFGERMVAIPLGVLTYSKGKEKGVGAAILFREISLLLGDFVAIISLIILLLLGIDIVYIFALASIFAILPLFSVFDKSLD